MIELDYRRHRGSGAGNEAPAWAELVPRWTQIDPVSYVIADAWHAWQADKMRPLARPDALLVASRQASAHADFAFSATGAVSPSRFVATLPSVMVTAMLQLERWSGPLLCIQNGDRSYLTALEEGFAMMDEGLNAVGIFGHSVSGRLGDRNTATVSVFYLGLRQGDPKRSAFGLRLISERGSSKNILARDVDFEEFLSSESPGRFAVGHSLMMERT